MFRTRLETIARVPSCQPQFFTLFVRHKPVVCLPLFRTADVTSDCLPDQCSSPRPHDARGGPKTCLLLPCPRGSRTRGCSPNRTPQRIDFEIAHFHFIARGGQRVRTDNEETSRDPDSRNGGNRLLKRNRSGDSFAGIYRGILSFKTIPRQVRYDWLGDLQFTAAERNNPSWRGPGSGDRCSRGKCCGKHHRP